MDKLARFAAVFLYLAATYLLIMWVTISFAITENGPIKWAEGWDRVVEQLLQ